MTDKREEPSLWQMGRRGFVGLLGLATLLGPRLAPASADSDQRWICTNSECRPYIYDPDRGDPTQGVDPGTAFGALPDDWYCPSCGAAKVEFRPYRS